MNEYPPIEIKNNKILLSYNSKEEALAVLKELKLLKKEQLLKKKELNTRQRTIRAGYTDYARTRSSKVRGGGKVGSFIRGVQQGNRDGARHDLANQLRPLQNQKEEIEYLLVAIEKSILVVEKDIENNEYSVDDVNNSSNNYIHNNIDNDIKELQNKKTKQTKEKGIKKVFKVFDNWMEYMAIKGIEIQKAKGKFTYSVKTQKIANYIFLIVIGGFFFPPLWIFIPICLFKIK